MKMILFSLLIQITLRASAFAATIHHSINVSINPALKQISAVDRITLMNSVQSLRFFLNKNLKITASSVQCSPVSGSTLIQSCLVKSTVPVREFQIQYSGVIFDPIVNEDTSGIISAEGVSLSSSSYWYPQLNTNELLTFDLSVTLPQGWTGRSQGDMPNQNTFVETLPQESIEFVANQFAVYSLVQNGIRYEVLLRAKDDALASSFLNLAPSYLENYSSQISAYPYSRFSVIENFYETGFGMPSFTLLGPSVIRLPFILNSSFPHEILHNWWGNSVYVDYSTGNWCEGLTTYMADHEQQRLQNKDHIYRMTTLVNYMDYAASGADFPLRKFINRHDQSTQAVGYGKAMMLFHMLKVQFGEVIFQKSFQRFYTDNVSRQASFDDIQLAFEKETGLNLKPLFYQWVDQTGAPKIEIVNAASGALTLRQSSTQNQFYDLHIPVTMTYQDQTKTTQVVNMNSAQATFALNLAPTKVPVKIEVDPNFDVFRLLDPSEKPSTFSHFFASKNFTYLHEAGEISGKPIFDNWTSSLGVRSQEQIIGSSTVLPTSGAYLVSGFSSRVQSLLNPLLTEVQDRVKVGVDSILIDGVNYSLADKVVILSLKSSVNPNLTIVWILGPTPALNVQLAQRLLHYGNFSALIFDAAKFSTAPTAPIPNIYKQIWLPSHSSMKRDL